MEQKCRLATRPEYKAHRREMYRERVEELKLLGILPRKRGRPTMYVGPEALEMKRQRAREAAARYRLKKYLSYKKMSTRVRAQVKNQIDAAIAAGTQPKAPRSGLGLVLPTGARFRMLYDKKGFNPLHAAVHMQPDTCSYTARHMQLDTRSWTQA